jgi:hypothetical protein
VVSQRNHKQMHRKDSIVSIQNNFCKLPFHIEAKALICENLNTINDVGRIIRNWTHIYH